MPISKLRQAPFSLEWGSSIIARVTATNTYGSSELSAEGNGAIILTNPDAPTNLVEDYAQRSATQLGLSWNQPSNNGGSPIRDYKVSYDQGSDTWIDLQSEIITKHYIATGLVPGTIYKFKVQARNAFGFSATSTELSLYCAFIPSIPLAPTTTVVANTVVVSWQEPAQNGAAISAYRIRIN